MALPRLLQQWLPRAWRRPPSVPSGLWKSTVSSLPFLAARPPEEQQRLRQLSSHFLFEKEFLGAHGLKITDRMALLIAAQACLPLLHLRNPGGKPVRMPEDVLAWYDDFVGIVVQPGAAVANREVTDRQGVVHRYREVLAGEAMDRGPVMLSWHEVSQAAQVAEAGSNVVIHEFAHKLDMRGMPPGQSPDGAPPLFAGLWGTTTGAQARSHWQHTMSEAYAQFLEALRVSERFGGEPPWLNSYAATHPAEFFAVTCEAYFVNRERFAQEFPTLVALYDGFFHPDD